MNTPKQTPLHLSDLLEHFHLSTRPSHVTTNEQALEHFFFNTLPTLNQPSHIHPYDCIAILQNALFYSQTISSKIVNTPNPPQTLIQLAENTLTFCEILYPTGFQNPKTTIPLHRYKKLDTPGVINFQLKTTTAANRLKSIASRLLQIKTTLDAYLNQHGIPHKLPSISAPLLFRTEIEHSKRLFEALDPTLEIASPNIILDSLDARNENLGKEATYDDLHSSSPEDGPQHEDPSEFTSFSQLYSPSGQENTETLLRLNRLNRKVVNASEWLWTEDAQPLAYITKFYSETTLPSLYQVYSLLDTAQSAPSNRNLASQALRINPTSSRNPSSLWQIIDTHFQNFNPNTIEFDSQTLKNLNSALFYLNLETTNQKFNIPHETFIRSFQSKIADLIDLQTSQTPLTRTRTEILFETLSETTSLSKPQQLAWLDSLYLLPPGCHEISTAIDLQRKAILSQLNGYFANLRADYTHAQKHSQLESKQVQNLISNTSQALFESLASPYSHIYRRELRFKLQAIQNWATQHNQTQTLEQAKHFTQYLRNLPHRVIDGSFFQQSETELKQLNGFTQLILSTPRIATHEFVESPETKPKHPIEELTNFFRTYSQDQTFPLCGHTIQQTVQLSNSENSQSNQSFYATIKALDIRFNNQAVPLKDLLEQRRDTLQGHLHLNQTLLHSDNPVQTLSEILAEEHAILHSPSLLPDAQPAQIPAEPHPFLLDTQPSTPLTQNRYNTLLDAISSELQLLKETARKDRLTHEEFNTALHLYNGLLRLEKQTKNLNHIDHHPALTSLLSETQTLLFLRRQQNLRTWSALTHFRSAFLKTNTDSLQPDLTISNQGMALTRSLMIAARKTLDLHSIQSNSLPKISIKHQFTNQITLPVALYFANLKSNSNRLEFHQHLIQDTQTQLKSIQNAIRHYDKQPEINLITEQERNQSNAIIINHHITKQSIQLLEEPQLLAKALHWQHNLEPSHPLFQTPELDTPIKRYTQFESGAQKHLETELVH